MRHAHIQHNNFCTRHQRGFTLVEVLVSLSIFMIVVTISVGALMMIITASTKAQNSQQVMTNLTFTLDDMTRDIRTGTDYYCGAAASLPVDGVSTADCASGSSGFSFNESGDSLTKNTTNHSRRIAFRLNGTAIERRLGNDAWEPLTASDVVITNFAFYVNGSSPTDTAQPVVTIYIKGYTGTNDDTQSQFNIETTVVQQVLDI